MFRQDNPKRKGSNAYKRYEVYKYAKDEIDYEFIWKKSKNNCIDGFDETSATWKTDLRYDKWKGYIIY